MAANFDEILKGFKELAEKRELEISDAVIDTSEPQIFQERGGPYAANPDVYLTQVVEGKTEVQQSPDDPDKFVINYSLQIN